MISEENQNIEMFRSNVEFSDINLVDLIDEEGISDEDDESDEASADESGSEIENSCSSASEYLSALEKKELYRLIPLKENIPEASNLIWRAVPYSCDENNNATTNKTMSKTQSKAYPKNMNWDSLQNTADVPESQVFLIDESDHLYRLRFKTQNAIVKPIHLRHRRVPDFDNDKFTQTRSKEAFNLKRYRFHTRYYLYVRRDRLIYFPKQYRKRKKKYGIPSPKKLQRKKYLQKHPGSRVGGRICLKTACIYVKVNDMAFKIRPNGPIPIVYAKPVVSEWDLHFTDLTFDTYCDERKNKAQIFGTYKRDDLSFTFDILNPTLDRIIPTSQRGCGMAFDDIVYIRTPKVLEPNSQHYCAIPRTTYYYRDPMINIKRETIRLNLDKRLPKWKEELIRKKLRHYRRQNTRRWDVSKTPGLNIMVEVCGHYVRARKDSVGVRLMFGRDLYECWAIDDQQSKLKVPKIVPPQCQTCTMLTKQVSLVININFNHSWYNVHGKNTLLLNLDMRIFLEKDTNRTYKTH